MDKKTSIASFPTDSEKVVSALRHPSAGDGNIPQDFREQDFLTRNGLNLRSFQRRKCPRLRCHIPHANKHQATGELRRWNWTAP